MGTRLSKQLNFEAIVIGRQTDVANQVANGFRSYVPEFLSIQCACQIRHLLTVGVPPV